MQQQQQQKKTMVPPPQNSILSLDETYVKKAKQRFMNTYCDISISDANSNIDPRFYDIDKYHDAVRLEKNELELAWKRRILIEYTPRGNIIMFYDVYKHGFSYYADNSMPYSILNAVAMKYVTLYRCRDFFMDEAIVPFGHISPFVGLFKDKETQEMEEKKKRQQVVSMIDVKQGPFAKFANKLPKTGLIVSNVTVKKRSVFSIVMDHYRQWLPHMGTAISQKPSIQVAKPMVTTVELAKNKMVYLGKCSNISILSKTASTNRSSVVSKSPIDVQYSSYKSWRSAPSSALFV